eukprot:4535523-Prymnesium_polylepis.1
MKEEFSNLIQEGKGDDIVDMFLNDAFTPGIDDSPNMNVNPVLAYIVNQERAQLKDEEAKKEAEEGNGGEEQEEKVQKQGAGGGAGHDRSNDPGADDDDNPNRFRRRNNFSPLKMLNFDIKKGKGAALDDSLQMKVVKVVEGHLQKAREIDVKKSTLKPDHKVKRGDKRYQKVRVITYNAAKAAWHVYLDKTQRGELDDDRTKQRAEAAAGARKQLAKKVLKTKVEEVQSA